eukprot:6498264-Prymnesium_polylepis.1
MPVPSPAPRPPLPVCAQSRPRDDPGVPRPRGLRAGGAIPHRPVASRLAGCVPPRPSPRRAAATASTHTHRASPRSRT